MLILKPQGRGNWAPLTVTIEGKRAAPLFFQVGGFFTITGRIYRICEVRV